MAPYFRRPSVARSACRAFRERRAPAPAGRCCVRWAPAQPLPPAPGQQSRRRRPPAPASVFLSLTVRLRAAPSAPPRWTRPRSCRRRPGLCPSTQWWCSHRRSRARPQRRCLPAPPPPPACIAPVEPEALLPPPLPTVTGAAADTVALPDPAPADGLVLTELVCTTPMELPALFPPPT